MPRALVSQLSGKTASSASGFLWKAEEHRSYRQMGAALLALFSRSVMEFGTGRKRVTVVAFPPCESWVFIPAEPSPDRSGFRSRRASAQRLTPPPPGCAFLATPGGVDVAPTAAARGGLCHTVLILLACFFWKNGRGCQHILLCRWLSRKPNVTKEVLFWSAAQLAPGQYFW